MLLEIFSNYKLSFMRTNIKSTALKLKKVSEKNPMIMSILGLFVLIFIYSIISDSQSSENYSLRIINHLEFAFVATFYIIGALGGIYIILMLLCVWVWDIPKALENLKRAFRKLQVSLLNNFKNASLNNEAENDIAHQAEMLEDISSIERHLLGSSYEFIHKLVFAHFLYAQEYSIGEEKKISGIQYIGTSKILHEWSFRQQSNNKIQCCCYAIDGKPDSISEIIKQEGKIGLKPLSDGNTKFTWYNPDKKFECFLDESPYTSGFWMLKFITTSTLTYRVSLPELQIDNFNLPNYPKATSTFESKEGFSKIFREKGLKEDPNTPSALGDNWTARFVSSSK